MASDATGTVRAAIAACPVGPWRSSAWRWHRASNDPLSFEGSRRVSGRYHRARAQDATGRVWPALYLALDTGAALAEAIRYLGPDGARSTAGRRLTEVSVSLARAIDVRDPSVLGLSVDDLTRDHDWTVPHPPTITQLIGLAALDVGAEGLLFPAASLVGNNLVIFPDNLSPASTLQVVRHIDPKLYVPRR
jgi:hypothetical protein